MVPHLQQLASLRASLSHAPHFGWLPFRHSIHSKRRPIPVSESVNALSALVALLWPYYYFVNQHTSLSPDKKLVLAVGDHPDGLLVDANSGETLHSMKGHHDYSFASAWSPDGQTFATGNQDKTCRVWDVRNLSKAVHVLKGNLGAIRSIRFTSDGQFLAMAEPADFVQIFDARSDYSKRQELDFFGEISGISFSPDMDALFVGVWDRTYGSLLQYGRLHNNN